MEERSQVRRRRKPKSIWSRMTPRIKMAAAGVLLVLLILIIVIAKGCSASSDESVLAKAFQTQAELSLPLEVELNQGDYVSYGGYQFSTPKKLSKMAKLIEKENEGVTATSYENAYGTCYVFTKENETGTDTWCLYQKDPANIEDWYIFMGTHREIVLPEGKMDVLLPLHLISDSYLRDNMGSRLELGTAYSCGLDKIEKDQSITALFRGFYEESGLYALTSLENGFSIFPKQNSSQELIFQFEETEDECWFTVSVPVVEEPEPISAITVASTEKEAEWAPVVLSEVDSVELSTILMEASYRAGQASLEYQYQFDLNGEIYFAELSWKNDTWSAIVGHADQIATLNAKSSCQIAAILLANDAPDVPSRDTDGWPGDVSDILTQAPACLVTTTDVNVRSMPATTGSILMTMTEGSSVAAASKTSNGWYEIWYNDQRAYMSADYLKAPTN